MAVPEAVMGGAEETEIVGLGAAAKRVGDHVIHLQQVPGAATAPTAPIHTSCSSPDRAPKPAV